MKVENSHFDPGTENQYPEPKINIPKLVPTKCCSSSRTESSSSMNLLCGCGRLIVRSLNVNTHYQLVLDEEQHIVIHKNMYNVEILKLEKKNN